MNGSNLRVTNQEKDLGIIVDSVLKFRQQAAQAVFKANRILAVIRRSFCTIDASTLPVLYKSLVRPHLEYGNAIWGPFFRGDQQSVERVRRRATKLVPELRGVAYPERLRRLNLPSLYYRRRRGDMIKTYQIIHGHICIDPAQLLVNHAETRTRGHPFKLVLPCATTRSRRNTFSVRIVNDWNGLPVDVVTATSLNQFKARLDRHWADMMYTIPYEDG